MNKRKLTTYAVVIVTILAAKLLEEYILRQLPNLKSFGNPYKSVAMRMLLMVFIFYPVFLVLNKFVGYASKHYFKISKKLSGSSFSGLVIGFVLAILIIYFIFAKLWYNIEIIKF